MMLLTGISVACVAFGQVASHAVAHHKCNNASTSLSISSPPYSNQFYSDCHSQTQVVVTSPLPGSNLTLIGPRLLIATPAGNSGVVTFFAPANGINGSLTLELRNFTHAPSPLRPIYDTKGQFSSKETPRVGIKGLLYFNSSAVLTVPILGSVRTIRDFTEGPSILVPLIQDSIKYSTTANGGASLSRLWLDNVTKTHLTFHPVRGADPIKLNNKTLTFEAGTYKFSASFNYPQLTQLPASAVLDNSSQALIKQDPSDTKALSFLSYNDKLLAGAWRFLTYFGRDSMISTLLLESVLSDEAKIAVIGSVLERVNTSSASQAGVCHEETIGDYATYLHLEANITSTAPSCSYIMIDSDYYLPIVMRNFFVNTASGKAAATSFFNTTATLPFANQGKKYSRLALVTLERIMIYAAAFAANGNQTTENLRHLETNQIVGEWRDSTYGIGGGRIPFDVNTALVPAALRAIADLSAAGFFKAAHPDWNETATAYAQVWEDSTLSFFAQTVPAKKAASLVASYASSIGVADPYTTTNKTQYQPQQDVNFHAISLQGNNNLSSVNVMHSDSAFRLFLLNTTNQPQLTSFLNETATNIQARFPVGLTTDIGMLVANPAFGGDPIYAANWTSADYHGTVVWGWPMNMMVQGLQRQLGRCVANATVPDFCNISSVYENVRAAYNHLWDLIDANTEHLGEEVWTWDYAGGVFDFVSYGSVSPTESDVRQLWSLSYLAVKRDQTLK